jgi:adenylate cyclase
MSEAQIQAIKDVIKMTPRLNIDCLNSVKVLMEKAIDYELLRLEPSIILENMDITEKVMYLDYIMESKEVKNQELKDAVSFEEILKREGLTIDDLQDKD